MRQFITGAVAALLVEVSVGLIIIGSGAAPVSADHPPSALETRVAFFDLVLGVKLTAEEKTDLVAFMRQL